MNSNKYVTSKYVTSETDFQEFEPHLDAIQTWLVQLEILISVSRFELALNWNQFQILSVRPLLSFF